MIYVFVTYLKWYQIIEIQWSNGTNGNIGRNGKKGLQDTNWLLTLTCRVFFFLWQIVIYFCWFWWPFLNLFLVVQHVFAVLFWNSLLQRASRVFQVFKLKTVRLGAFCSFATLGKPAEEIQHFHWFQFACVAAPYFNFWPTHNLQAIACVSNSGPQPSIRPSLSRAASPSRSCTDVRDRRDPGQAEDTGQTA